MIESLIDAVEAGNIDEINNLLAQPMENSDETLSILADAIASARYKEDNSVVEALFSAYTRIAPDKVGMIYVNELFNCAGSSTDKLRIVIDCGGKDYINSRSTEWVDGETLLMLAVDSGLTDSVKLLIDNGALVDAGDNSGMTPLMLAVRGGHDDMVQLLIDSQASVDAKDKQGMTALMIAASETYDHVDEGENTLFMECQAKAVNVLVRGGAEINATDLDNQTALMIAIKSRRIDMLELLLELGADYQGALQLVKEAGGEYESLIKKQSRITMWSALEKCEKYQKQLAKLEEEAPKCPISMAPMHEPMVLISGHSVERSYAEKMKQEDGKYSCPITRKEGELLISNYGLREQCEIFWQKAEELYGEMKESSKASQLDEVSIFQPVTSAEEQPAKRLKLSDEGHADSLSNSTSNKN